MNRGLTKSVLPVSLISLRVFLLLAAVQAVQEFLLPVTGVLERGGGSGRIPGSRGREKRSRIRRN